MVVEDELVDGPRPNKLRKTPFTQAAEIPEPIAVRKLRFTVDRFTLMLEVPELLV